MQNEFDGTEDAAEWTISERSDAPILLPDRAWESGGMVYPVGLFGENKGPLRLYYMVRFNDRVQDNALCMAESDDGANWRKPDLGSGHNIVMRGSGNAMNWGEFMPSRILQDDRETDPAKRWKMLYWDRPRSDGSPGFCLACSPDGLTWLPVTDHPFITNANDAGSMVIPHAGEHCQFGECRYWVYQQTWKYNPALPQGRDNLKAMHRRISLWTASTLTGAWTGPVTILEPDEADEPDLQFYNLAPFRLRNGYGGLLSRHHTTDQTMDMELVTSTDGWSWRRTSRRALLAPGAASRFDCGLIYATVPPVHWKGRTQLVYGGRATTHDGRWRHPALPPPDPASGIGMATLRDGRQTNAPGN